LPLIVCVQFCERFEFGDELRKGTCRNRGDEGGALFEPGELAPVGGDGSELELLYKFVDGFGQRIPALLRTEFAQKAQ